MSVKNIPINKGNYSMEPIAREECFERYRGEEWPNGYQEYRNNWTEYAKMQVVSDYPLLVDLELSSLCNLTCPMCYTITEEFKQHIHATLMDFELFKKVIREIAGKVPAIRLSLRGEPTLHPHFIEAIKFAKKNGIHEVSALTNGSKLSADYFTDMMEAGIDWITISVDGLNEKYESIRKPLQFVDILQKIKDIQVIKKKNACHRPVIKIQSIWPAIKEDPETFYNTFAPYTDLIAFNPLIDYLGQDSEILYESEFSCPQLYQRLVIGADGLVMMCSNDENGTVILGDANIDTIHDIWHGKNLENIRKVHREPDGFRNIPVCKHCYLPRKTEDSEHACVNGRNIIIKNYVNRSQVIGQ
ncbi:MoaA/NifB/PqqE/SkfB family radical SAM enzyme [Sporomusaceae bacterium BoRhaA]|uniref:radical SAM/SPASM domain-containing protein n=1 Tax=Pelorhabdus rhamnosifermentans TaxID=2772457 RepID=UPI001C062B22|nr:radical SAM/SPASM domain-containing protein [Pelorhabdus rhamnosifermentans]MBU2699168.1 MoaA/NifB/PqqE/SkfB family radical SAM enzyme [Pelorhabdus rhamnosifermentans]